MLALEKQLIGKSRKYLLQKDLEILNVIIIGHVLLALTHDRLNLHCRLLEHNVLTTKYVLVNKC